MGAVGAFGGEQDNTRREKSMPNRKYVCVISLHVIYIPLGTDDIVQSLKEKNRRTVIEARDNSHHLDVDGGRNGRMRKPLFPESLLMNPKGHSLLEGSFYNSLIALKLNGILQIRNSFFI